MDSLKRVSSKTLLVIALLCLAAICQADDDETFCIVSSGEDFNYIRCSDVTDYSAATANFTDEQVSKVNRVFIVNSPDLVLKRADFHKPTYENLLRVEHILSNQTTINIEPLQGLNLKWLSYEANNLTAVNDNAFSGLDSLEILILNLNQIETLSEGAFHGPDKLESIDLNDNKLSTINPATFNGLKLKQLHLNRNLLTTIDKDSFSGLGNLTHLYLDSNEIRSINALAFRNNPELLYLNLGNNKLESLPSDLFATNLNFSELHLNYNNLENLSNFPITASSLRGLNLQSCNIHTIPEGYFAQLTHLRKLSLQANKISEIGINFYPPSPDLRFVLLDENDLKSLSVESFAPLRRIIDQYPKNEEIKDRSDRYQVTLRHNPWNCSTDDMIRLRAHEESTGRSFNDTFQCEL